MLEWRYIPPLLDHVQHPGKLESRMPNRAVEAAINDQIAMEFYSAYLYLSMAGDFTARNLNGFAHWMRMQYEEELAHANKLFDFVLENGGQVVLQAIDKPPSGFDSPLAVMEQSLEHEQEVTASIIRLYELAIKEKDYPAQLMLQWFISEQTEEERTVADIIAQLKIAGDNASAWLLIDRELASRTNAE
jgi:ferritin